MGAGRENFFTPTQMVTCVMLRGIFNRTDRGFQSPEFLTMIYALGIGA